MGYVPYRYESSLAPQVILITSTRGCLISVDRPDAVVLAVGKKRAFRDGSMVRFSPTEAKIALCLLAAQGRQVCEDELIEFVWGDDPDGGPEDAGRMVRVFIYKVRHILRALNIGIESGWGRGFRAVDLAGAQQIEEAA